ncbi:MAG TPA: putative peptidoglycan glycosyltransferase FtsW [Candidatus Paceibacterota bacterium]|nr:putative peptidoglycan glycosyltransferase FtsW [Candidatus Paceibacterota bacterium]
MAKGEVKPFDRYFFSVVLIITIIGIFTFVSASLGILVRSEEKFYSVLFNQIILGLVCGVVGMFVVSRIHYTFWRKYAFYIFLGVLGLTLLVFVPGVGFAHGGARRWIDIGPVSFQPAELLKLGFVIYFAAWLAWVRKRGAEVKYKIAPFLVLVGIVGVTLLKQPDTKSIILIIGASAAMLFVSGVSWKKIALVFGLMLVGVGILAYTRPYVMSRVQTFLNPASDPQGASYQLQQSLIAIGSGGIFGRGLGQSVQKFNYLPEPQGDSIFAVYAEEFGLAGTLSLLVLYIFLALRGYKIALRAPDAFAQYLVVGLVSLLTLQSFLNIGALVGILPLTGVPLVFISHGGTALAIALMSAGMVLNVSRFKKEYTKKPL